MADAVLKRMFRVAAVAGLAMVLLAFGGVALMVSGAAEAGAVLVIFGFGCGGIAVLSAMTGLCLMVFES